MVRTQISLNPEEIDWLKREAKQRGASTSAVVRELIHDARLPASTPKKTRKLSPSQKEAVKKRFPWIGMLKDGPPTDARLSEEYLYGAKEPL
jgi:hypothetical protein